MLTLNTQFVVNQVTILSLRTPGDPVDLQLILDSNWNAGRPTELDVRMRTNISVAFFEVLDVTFRVPPLSVGVSGKLPNSTTAPNTGLFTVTVPSIRNKVARTYLLADTNVSVPDVYGTAFWLQDVINELEGKIVYAQPVYDGSLWSMIVSPVFVEVSVADAIDPNRGSREIYKDYVEANDTWSKAVFALQVSTSCTPSNLDLII